MRRRAEDGDDEGLVLEGEKIRRRGMDVSGDDRGRTRRSKSSQWVV